MDYNTPSARESLTRADAFGEKLENDGNFVLLSPTTYQYNCIAYAMGMQDRWVDNADLPWHWWPPVNKGSKDTDLVNAFQYFGFEECGMDDSVDEKYDKVALYHDADSWTHAACIVGEGVYHSKFGASYDGTHSRGDILIAQYGEPFVIMKRLKSEAHITDDLKGIAPGVIHTNFKVMIGGQYDHIVAFGGKIYLGEHGCEIRLIGGSVVLI